MLVVTFSATGKQNCVIVGGVPYIYARTRLGPFLMPAGCLHKGGPLHLASLERGGTCLVCPWHGRALPVTRMLRSGIPATRRGSVVTAVFAVPAGTGHEVGYRPVSADLAAAALPGG
jgi:hypothetical protein